MDYFDEPHCSQTEFRGKIEKAFKINNVNKYTVDNIYRRWCCRISASGHENISVVFFLHNMRKWIRQDMLKKPVKMRHFDERSKINDHHYFYYCRR